MSNGRRALFAGEHIPPKGATPDPLPIWRLLGEREGARLR